MADEKKKRAPRKRLSAEEKENLLDAKIATLKAERNKIARARAEKKMAEYAKLLGLLAEEVVKVGKSKAETAAWIIGLLDKNEEAKGLADSMMELKEELGLIKPATAKPEAKPEVKPEPKPAAAAVVQPATATAKPITTGAQPAQPAQRPAMPGNGSNLGR